jgi:uncharacterized coiled-coil protein SlyX
MTTHTDPRIEERLKTVEDYLTQHVATRKQVEKLDTKMVNLEGKLNDVQEDVKAIKDFLLPPKP